MNNISDKDLVLLYYGENEDPGLAAAVAANPELTGRFEALTAEMEGIDRYAPPARNDDYGADTWLGISPRLAGREKRGGFLQRITAGLSQPRFSLAGIAGVAAVAVLAFMFGRQGFQAIPETMLTPGLTPGAAAQLDAGRLLTASVSGHLEQVDILFTEFAHSDRSRVNEAGRATDMLVANRLYRQAAAARGDQQLATFLAGLEPLLIEMAYEAHRDSPATRGRMQQEIKDHYLFRVRAVNHQLQNSPIST